jgi:hypothetical protein
MDTDKNNTDYDKIISDQSKQMITIIDINNATANENLKLNKANIDLDEENKKIKHNIRTLKNYLYTNIILFTILILMIIFGFRYYIMITTKS